MKTRRAVFLDRDGVLVRGVVHDGQVYGPLTLAEFVLLPGVRKAVERLRAAGFLTVLATNQPGISRGVLDWATLDEMHRRLREAVPLDAIKVCPHANADRCDCRKPKPGMLLEAGRELDLDLAASYFIGDTFRDVEAALAAGVTPVLIDAAYNRDVAAPRRAASLAAAVDWIVGADRLRPPSG